MGYSVGAVWNYYRTTKGQSLAVGEVKVRFSLERDGRLVDVEVVSNSASAVNAAYAIRSVREAEFPPVPADLVARMKKDRYIVNLKLNVLPN